MDGDGFFDIYGFFGIAGSAPLRGAGLGSVVSGLGFMVSRLGFEMPGLGFAKPMVATPEILKTTSFQKMYQFL